MNFTDYLGWGMVIFFCAAMWVMAIMVIIDPPALFLRFFAPLAAAGVTCALLAVAVDATG